MIMVIYDFDHSWLWSVKVLVSLDFGQVGFWSVLISINYDFGQLWFCCQMILVRYDVGQFWLRSVQGFSQFWFWLVLILVSDKNCLTKNKLANKWNTHNAFTAQFFRGPVTFSGSAISGLATVQFQGLTSNTDVTGWKNIFTSDHPTFKFLFRVIMSVGVIIMTYKLWASAPSY